ncbi:MAG: prepilin-type N-terminal cleavage/methylation domain-containing protein [Verrucomicrobiae bacterium]|nr:prepilin-type N-terminal cleavage/methylation domain-containing protein [Verrucomicrobiae bacterium]
MTGDRDACRGLTLMELLVAVTILAVLAAMSFPVFRQVRAASSKVIAVNTLNQCRVAGMMYQDDNNGDFWPYRKLTPGLGVQWWFGLETTVTNAEGTRVLDMRQGTLGQYFGESTRLKTDPAFAQYGAALKPKFTSGAFGFGYNVLLGGGWMGMGTVRNRESITNASQLVIFATSAQVNTFQAPASSANPMIEEFYGFDTNTANKTVHFRLGEKALVVFADGRLDLVPMDASTQDLRMPQARIGSLGAQYLQ